MSDDDDDDNVTYLQAKQPPPRKPPARKPRAKGRRPGHASVQHEIDLKTKIPVLPPIEEDIASYLTRDEKRSKTTNRERAIVTLRIEGYDFARIAQLLGMDGGSRAAQRAYYQVLADLHPPEDYETQRQLAAMRAEQQFQRSVAMARADYLLDSESGEKMPNADRLRWHDQASRDLALHISITGAKAPARMEITPTEEQYRQIVDRVLEIEGHNTVVEADIVDVEEIPDGPEPE